MELTLLRHGIPVEPGHWGGDEGTRPLTPAGREQVRAVIRTLADSGRIAADEVWTSPLVRADETARIAAEELELSCHVSQGLASGLDLLRSLPATQGDPARWPARLLLVGHAPDLGYLVSALTGAPGGRYALGRSGLARLTGTFSAGGMKLDWIRSAEEILKGL